MTSSSSMPGVGTRESEATDPSNAELLWICYGSMFQRPSRSDTWDRLPLSEKARWSCVADGFLKSIAAAPVSLSGGEEKGQGATLKGQATQQSPSPSVSALTGECPSRGSQWRYAPQDKYGQWRCPDCRCHSFSFIASEDSLVRCVNCKEVFSRVRDRSGEATETLGSAEGKSPAGLSATPEPLPLLSEQKHREGRE